MPIFKDNSESIGRTPLIHINRMTRGSKATVLAKVEGRNPPTVSNVALAPR